MELVKLISKKVNRSSTGLMRYVNSTDFYFIINDEKLNKLKSDVGREKIESTSFCTGDIDLVVNFRAPALDGVGGMNENIPVITNTTYNLLRIKCDKCGSENCEKLHTDEGIRCEVCYKYID